MYRKEEEEEEEEAEEEEEEEEEEEQMDCKQRLLKMPSKFRFQVKSKSYYTFL